MVLVLGISEKMPIPNKNVYTLIIKYIHRMKSRKNKNVLKPLQSETLMRITNSDIAVVKDKYAHKSDNETPLH